MYKEDFIELVETLHSQFGEYYLAEMLWYRMVVASADTINDGSVHVLYLDENKKENK